MDIKKYSSSWFPPVIDFSHFPFLSLYSENKISFRNANDLRKTVCVYTAPVTTKGLWVASSLSLPSILFYDDYEAPGTIRNANSETKPPKPGKNRGGTETILFEMGWQTRSSCCLHCYVSVMRTTPSIRASLPNNCPSPWHTGKSTDIGKTVQYTMLNILVFSLHLVGVLCHQAPVVLSQVLILILNFQLHSQSLGFMFMLCC